MPSTAASQAEPARKRARRPVNLTLSAATAQPLTVHTFTEALDKRLLQRLVDADVP